MSDAPVNVYNMPTEFTEPASMSNHVVHKMEHSHEQNDEGSHDNNSPGEEDDDGEIVYTENMSLMLGQNGRYRLLRVFQDALEGDDMDKAERVRNACEAVGIEPAVALSVSTPTNVAALWKIAHLAGDDYFKLAYTIHKTRKSPISNSGVAPSISHTSSVNERQQTNQLTIHPLTGAAINSSNTNTRKSPISNSALPPSLSHISSQQQQLNMHPLTGAASSTSTNPTTTNTIEGGSYENETGQRRSRRGLKRKEYSDGMLYLDYLDLEDGDHDDESPARTKSSRRGRNKKQPLSDEDEYDEPRIANTRGGITTRGTRGRRGRPPMNRQSNMSQHRGNMLMGDQRYGHRAVPYVSSHPMMNQFPPQILMNMQQQQQWMRNMQQNDPNMFLQQQQGNINPQLQQQMHTQQHIGGFPQGAIATNPQLQNQQQSSPQQQPNPQQQLDPMFIQQQHERMMQMNMAAANKQQPILPNANLPGNSTNMMMRQGGINPQQLQQHMNPQMQHLNNPHLRQNIQQQQMMNNMNPLIQQQMNANRGNNPLSMVWQQYQQQQQKDVLNKSNDDIPQHQNIQNIQQSNNAI